MVKVQFKDGQTLSFDLNQKSDSVAWKNFSNGRSWFGSVTAMAIVSNKALHTLPAPNSGLEAYGFGAGLIMGKPKKRILGESVWFCIGDIRIELSVYNTHQKSTKVTVQRLQVKSED